VSIGSVRERHPDHEDSAQLEQALRREKIAMEKSNLSKAKNT
jgi:hypothetical protein